MGVRVLQAGEDEDPREAGIIWAVEHRQKELVLYVISLLIAVSLLHC